MPYNNNAKFNIQNSEVTYTLYFWIFVERSTSNSAYKGNKSCIFMYRKINEHDAATTTN